MATFTWSGAAKDGDFLNPKNWKITGVARSDLPTSGDVVVIGNGDAVTLGPRVGADGKPLLDQQGVINGVTIGSLTLSNGSTLEVQDNAALDIVQTGAMLLGKNGPIAGSIVARTGATIDKQLAKLGATTAPTPVDTASNLVIGKGSSITIDSGGALRGAVVTSDPAKLIPLDGATLQNMILLGNWTPPNPAKNTVATITVSNTFLTFALDAKGEVPAGGGSAKSTTDLTTNGGVILKLTGAFDYHDATLILGGAVGSGIEASAVKGGKTFPITLADTVDVVQKGGVASIGGSSLITKATIRQTGGTLTVTAAKFVNEGSIRVDGKGTSFVVGGKAGDGQTSFTNAADHTITVTDGASLKASDYAAVNNLGTITVRNSTAIFDALLKGGGAFNLDGKAVATFNRGTDKGVKLNFDSADAKVVVGKDAITTFHAALTGAVKGDSITLDGVTQAQVKTAINGNTATVTVYDATDKTKVLTTFTIMSTAPIKAIDKTGNADTTLDLGCLVAGTLVLTAAGERAVEALAVGDFLLVSRAGALVPARIRWIGSRTIDPRRVPDPAPLCPIRIARNAVAPGVPRRDVLVSPDHAIFLDGGLIQARQLLNGVTVRREPARGPVTYFHVELDRHAVLLAEGLPVESYLDAGDRHIFTDTAVLPGAVGRLFAGSRAEGACAPLLTAAAQAEPVWRRLAERAGALDGLPAKTSDARLRVVAGGRTLVPITRAGGWSVALPRLCREVRLVSRAAAPCETSPWLDDRRRLGVRVAALTLRAGAEWRVVPADDPDLRVGWWKVEHDAGGPWRWTDGDALVAFAARWDVLEISGCAAVYPVEACAKSAICADILHTGRDQC